ncbi:MAG: membrane protein insertase YidC [Geobacteraceae bacterium]|nr:membrane protein insertase YidC [Geobacteraceae bacterium]
MENKNTILALILMLVVWTAFTFLFPPQDDKGTDVSQQKNQSVENSTEDVSKLSDSSSSVDIHTSLPEGGYKTLSSDEFVSFENDFYALQFNRRGGVISSVKLLKYRQENSADAPPVNLLDKDTKISTLNVLSGSGFNLSGDETYKIDKVKSGNEREVVLSTKLKNGIEVTKVFRFSPDSYLVNVDVNLYNHTDKDLTDVVQVRLNNYWEDAFADNRFDYIGFTSYVDGELHEDKVEDISSASKTYTGGISWSGYTNKYFLSALVNKNRVFDAVALERNAERITNSARVSDFNIPANSKATISFDVYLGPKNIDFLSAAGENLKEVVDFGFFAFLSKPLHLCLKFFYDYVQNYGVAIIILTVIIKLLFWPLTQKSYTSMKAMQTLQPEMKKLREKYRGDKEGLNRSMMELYKEHRVNPLGGCLPMLVQIPVFIALYKVLLGTIELRHAPFALWITDLSVKDPYYITPIIMGATMFIQQKMTPSTMDPLQAKIMLAMPVVFTFIFLNFPSGLVLYWLVNNLLTIFQQYLIYRKPAPVKL